MLAYCIFPKETSRERILAFFNRIGAMNWLTVGSERQSKKESVCQEEEED